MRILSAAVGAIFATTKVVAGAVRGTDDAFNSALAGCAAGAMAGVKRESLWRYMHLICLRGLLHFSLSYIAACICAVLAVYDAASLSHSLRVSLASSMSLFLFLWCGWLHVPCRV